MVALRSRRLERLFGGPLGDVVHGQVASLVTGAVAEAYDLDFKGELYGRSDRDKRDLASDVAAMANTAGGVVLLGIEEDDQARAKAAPGVALSDAESGRIHQIVAAQVSPLPVLDVVQVEDPASPGRGFILIAVPKSPAAPHAVLINDALRFPRRNGRTTRHLSEPEVAEAYAARLAGIMARADTLARLESEFIKRLNASTQTFLVVTLVPELAGDFTIDTAAVRNFREAMIGRSPLMLVGDPSWTRAGVDSRKLVADGSYGDGPGLRWLACELHDTGAGCFAVMIDRRDQGNRQRDAGTESQVGDESAVRALWSGIQFLARHARDRAAVGGNASVRTTISPVSQNVPATLVHHRFISAGDRLGPQTITAPPTAEGIFDIDDLAEDGAAALVATYELASRLFQAFGQPESLQVTPAGELRTRYWRPEWHRALRAWADTAGVVMTEKLVD